MCAGTNKLLPSLALGLAVALLALGCASIHQTREQKNSLPGPSETSSVAARKAYQEKQAVLKMLASYEVGITKLLVFELDAGIIVDSLGGPPTSRKTPGRVPELKLFGRGHSLRKGEGFLSFRTEQTFQIGYSGGPLCILRFVDNVRRAKTLLEPDSSI